MEMKKTEDKKAKQVQTIAVCCCLCLLAVGAGVTYRAFDRSHLEKAEPTEVSQPVTAVKTPTIEVSALDREKQSNDPGEAPATEQKQEAKPTFAYPLQGEVLLPYSIDHAIYDPTLEQYRTNASISLGAEQGDMVKAAADGTVQEIAEDAEMGKTIVIAHKGGWLTTYGQLEDTVSVQEGEPVKQGQVIGAVDVPTKYGTALGAHLEFAMEKNGAPVDPQEKLKAE